MQLRSGVKLLAEIEGCGDPIQDNDRYDAVLKFYRNRGEPLTMRTAHSEPIPKVAEDDGVIRIGWDAPELVESHIVIERNRALSRGAEVLPGVYYSILGMRRGATGTWPSLRTSSRIRCTRFSTSTGIPL